MFVRLFPLFGKAKILGKSRMFLARRYQMDLGKHTFFVFAISLLLPVGLVSNRLSPTLLQKYPTSALHVDGKIVKVYKWHVLPRGRGIPSHVLILFACPFADQSRVIFRGSFFFPSTLGWYEAKHLSVSGSSLPPMLLYNLGFQQLGTTHNPSLSHLPSLTLPT